MVTSKNNKRKRKSYSLEKKKKIINFTMKNSRLSQRDLSVHFKMPLGVINKILKEKDTLLSLDEKLSNKKKYARLLYFRKLKNIFMNGFLSSVIKILFYLEKTLNLQL